MPKWLRGALPVALTMSVSILVNDSIFNIVEAPLTQEKVQTKIMEVMIRNKEAAMV
jgi:hypothetical protein